MTIAVAVETGSKRTFASALDWPGWARSGKNEAAALEALALYARRYAEVARLAGQRFPAVRPGDFQVVERVAGSASTDFGVPGEVLKAERIPLTRNQVARQAALVEAAWKLLDRTVARAPAELRKGPRGGGRDRDEIDRHVQEAEGAYARKLGLRLPSASASGKAARAAARGHLLRALETASTARTVEPKAWPGRYAARRIAWHVLDHAWEIEDRSAPG